MSKAVKFKLELIKKIKESEDAYTFYFKRPDNFNFFSGQYLKIFLDIDEPDERGSSRYFTISSSPYEKSYLTITTRIINSSFKLKLKSLSEGEIVLAFGPIGYFSFDSISQKNVVFIAGGIGVTPFHSILKSFDYEKLNLNLTLLNSFELKKNIIFYDELKRIESENPNIKIIYSLTKDKNYIKEFEQGRINIKMIRKYTKDFNKAYYFLTGPVKMVNEMFDMLLKAGIKEARIFKEDFPGY